MVSNLEKKSCEGRGVLGADSLLVLAAMIASASLVMVATGVSIIVPLALTASLPNRPGVRGRRVCMGGGGGLAVAEA